MLLLSLYTATRRGPVPNSLKHDMQDDFNCDTCGHTVQLPGRSEDAQEEATHGRGDPWTSRLIPVSLLKTIPVTNFYVGSTQPFCFHHITCFSLNISEILKLISTIFILFFHIIFLELAWVGCVLASFSPVILM